MDGWWLAAAAAALGAAAAGLVGALRRSRTSDATALAALVHMHQRLGHELAQVREALGELRGRLAESGVRDGAMAAQLRALHEGLVDARTTLAALQRGEEETRRRQTELATALGRIEAVIVGARSRGLAGERLLATVLENLPPAFRATHQPLRGGVVEFAFQLPNGRLVPIDSKWVAATELERLHACADDRERRELVRRLEAILARKVDEVARYLDPDRTLGLAVLAVPDALYTVTTSVHVRALERGVIIVAYSMAVPYLLTLLHFCQRFLAPDDRHARWQIGLAQLDRLLHELQRTLDGPFARAVSGLHRQATVLRGRVAEAAHLARALRTEGTEQASPPPSAPEA